MSENRLRHETSPYLLQHQDNPVHWWAWGPEALAEAKRSGKPILLSVGYAACHWCHVMAHESFEDAETASVMNELFVNIKVDREERPDIDAIYMGALHRLGQQGGWPMTMFLDSDARPFWGGTYFPKTSGWGRPAFVDVLQRVSEIFHSEPEKVSVNAKALVGALSETDEKSHGADVTDALLRELTARMARAIDPVHGGITGAPKFPQWTFFWLLWRGAIRYRNEAAKTAVITTLERMCQGGIYDHLGGGFARYSVDERWLVPHFEKMLYDNALLVDLMTEVWRETKCPLLEARITETIGWLEREMIAEGGWLRGISRCGLGGRGRQVLRLERRGDPRRSRQRRRRTFLPRLRRHARGQLRRPYHLEPPRKPGASGSQRRGPPRAHAPKAPRSAHEAHSSWLGRQGARRLERLDDRSTRPCRSRL